MAKLRSTQYLPHQLPHPDFKYVSAAATDISVTFERARQAMAKQAANEAERRSKVRTILKAKG